MGNNYCQLYGIVKEFCGASWAVSLKILKYFFCIFFFLGLRRHPIRFTFFWSWLFLLVKLLISSRYVYSCSAWNSSDVFNVFHTNAGFVDSMMMSVIRNLKSVPRVTKLVINSDVLAYSKIYWQKKYVRIKSSLCLTYAYWEN